MNLHLQVAGHALEADQHAFLRHTSNLVKVIYCRWAINSVTRGRLDWLW